MKQLFVICAAIFLVGCENSYLMKDQQINKCYHNNRIARIDTINQTWYFQGSEEEMRAKCKTTYSTFFENPYFIEQKRTVSLIQKEN